MLIIGGMGIIGGAISEAAVNNNDDVYILSRRAPFEKWLDIDATYIQGDWKDDFCAREVLKREYDVIVDTQVFDKKQLNRSMDLCNGHCKQYIYISTDSVYTHPGEDVREDEQINIKELQWSYGKNKRMAELELLKTGDRYDFFWTVIRPTITFGETRIPVGFTSKRKSYTMIQRLREGKPIVRFDNPNTKHAICHISTFGQAVIGLFLDLEAAGQFYHISDDNCYTYDEIFRVIEHLLGIKGNYIFVPDTTIMKLDKNIYEEIIYDKNPVFTLDNSKIKAISLEANYTVDIQQAIEDTLNYLQSVNVDVNKDKKYNLLSDAILVTNLEHIKDEDERRVAATYVDSLSKEYKKELKKFILSSRKTQKILSIKKKLYPIKEYLIKRRHKNDFRRKVFK